MFDIGISQIAVVGVVALIVLGPERLPKVARTAGHLLGRLQRYANDVKADINREIQLDELKRMRSEVTASAREIEDAVRNEYQSAQKSMEGVSESIDAANKEIQQQILAEDFPPDVFSTYGSQAEKPAEKPLENPTRQAGAPLISGSVFATANKKQVTTDSSSPAA